MTARVDPDRLTAAERLMLSDQLALEMCKPIPPKPSALPTGIVRVGSGVLTFDWRTMTRTAKATNGTEVGGRLDE